MIDILDNLISLSMLTMGYVLDNIVILLRNPFGFIAIFSSITFLEYSTAKNIIKDIKKDIKTTDQEKRQLLPHNDIVAINSV